MLGALDANIEGKLLGASLNKFVSALDGMLLYIEGASLGMSLCRIDGVLVFKIVGAKLTPTLGVLDINGATLPVG